MRLHHFILPVIILVFAASLRLYQLDFRALWWDEGLSLFFARLNYIENARLAVTLADTNPPVYRLLLGVWTSAVGSSAFAARLFSVMPGLVLVAVVYRLGRAPKFSRETSLVAMALCAASPMLIYYAQEAKGYSLVAMAGTASVLLWLKLTPPPGALPRRTTLRERRNLWGLYAFTLLLAIGSHYISAFLIAVENLWTLALTIRSWRGNERRWLGHWAWVIAAQAVAAALLLPFVLLTYGGTSAAVRGETGGFGGLNGPIQFFGQHALELTQGPTANGTWALIVAAAVIGLAIIGIWDLEVGSWKLLSWIGAPLLLGFALNSYHEFFFPRFVLYTVPAIMLLAAEGLARFTLYVSRFVRISLTTLFIVHLSFVMAAWTPTLLTHYTTPTTLGEDWRPVANAMRPLVRQGDAAIHTWGWMPGYLDAYLPPASRPQYTLGFFTPESLDSDMRAITAGRSRVWLLDYEIDQFDIRNMAGGWLRTEAALVYDAWPGEGQGHIALFALRQTPTSSPGLFTVTFANGLKLEVTEMQTELAPGDALAVTMLWEASQPISDRYTIFLHGQAADGTLAFGRDSEPNNGLSFVTDWKPGERHSELRGVLIPPDTPPGRYWLTVGIYNTMTSALDERGPAVIGAVTIR
ncbi:MAG TPA: glycosyltransferase family 39 protein [Anaerolineales bacterium]|nr:glycosyltransferase family 39 protein [Anaerolineales bacterium]